MSANADPIKSVSAISIDAFVSSWLHIENKYFGSWFFSYCLTSLHVVFFEGLELDTMSVDAVVWWQLWCFVYSWLHIENKYLGFFLWCLTRLHVVFFDGLELDTMSVDRILWWQLWWYEYSMTAAMVTLVIVWWRLCTYGYSMETTLAALDILWWQPWYITMGIL